MRNKKRIVFGVVAIFLVIFVVFFIQKQTLQINVERVKEFIRSFGILGPVVFITLNITTNVFAPLTSFPFWLASLALYGFWQTCFYVIIGNSVGWTINFLIAKRFGRPVVTKLIGQKGTKKIDEITEIVGLKTLFLARLFGGVGADYISYAAGLTSMKFKPYLLISVFVAIPVICFNVYILDKALTVKPIYIVFLGAWGYLLAIIFPILVYKKMKKDEKAKNEVFY